jgi:DNA-binding transcriptional LysR family regulator
MTTVVRMLRDHGLNARWHANGVPSAVRLSAEGELAAVRLLRQICCFNGFDKGSFEMRNINLDQLRALIEVVECRSFSAAARSLNLSQPAVSLQIRELERRFGVPLIERFGKQAHATAPGRELIKAAQRIFDACTLAEEAMRRFRENWVGRVHLSTTLTAMIYRLPPLLRKLRSDHPGVDLVVTNMPTPISIARVLSNEADLALVTLPVENSELRVKPLCQEAMLAAYPAGEKDVPEEITPEYIMRQRLLLLTEQPPSAGHATVMRWVAAGTPSMAVGTIEALKSAVASNVGMAILPEVAVHPNMANIMLRPLRPALHRTLALIEHRNKPNEPALQIVRTALMELATPAVANSEVRSRLIKSRRTARKGASSKRSKIA